MRCLLMNKNIEILAAEYDTANGVFLKVLDVYKLAINNHKPGYREKITNFIRKVFS